MVVSAPVQSYTVSDVTLAEVERVFRNMEFFETRAQEQIVKDGTFTKEMPKKKLNRE